MAGVGALPKKAQNIENVRARCDLLIDGISRPNSVNKALHTALVGQRAFAALELPNSKITQIALNTLKSLSDELFIEPDEDGRTGFAYLNALRIKLGQRIEEVCTSRTIEAKAERHEDAKDNLLARLSAVEAHSIKRDKAYLSLYSSINRLIKSGELHSDAQERLYRVLENHHSAFASLFEPDIGSATGNETKVTKLHQDEPSK